MGFFAVLGLLFPYLFLTHLLTFIWLAWRRSRYAWYALGTLVMGGPYLLKNVHFHERTSDPSEISVATFNVHRMNLDNDRQVESASERVLRTVGKPDIFCLQEMSSNTLESFNSLFTYPHIYSHATVGTIILSKHPMLNSGRIEFENSGNSVAWADIGFDQKVIRVYNVHLESNRVSSDVQKLRKEGDLRSRDTWQTIRNVFRDFSQRAIIRTQQLARLTEHLAQSPHPVILTGDLNDTPQSYTYRGLSRYLQDGFTQRGSGFSYTYAGPIPLLRIDYIFASEEVEFQSYRTNRLVRSDHFPVIARVKLK